MTEVLLLGDSNPWAQPGGTVTLRLRWNAVPMSEDYRVFVHFVGANGVNYSGSDADHNPPVPTTQWSGSIVYNRTISVPSSVPNGNYTIRVGLYQPYSPWGRATLKAGSNVTVDDQLRYTVGTLRVGPTTEILPLGITSLNAQPGQSVTLKMRFNAVPMPQDYYVFVHFVDSNGVHHSSLNADHLPPTATSKWSGAIAYDRTITLPSTVAAGTYSIRVGLYPMAVPEDRVELKVGSGVTVDGAVRYIVGTLTVGSLTEVLQLGTPNVTAQPGQNVTLKMRFNAVPLSQDYNVFVHFVDSNGVQQSFQMDHPPPVATSKWSGPIAYDYTKALPSTAAPGKYTIRVGLYPLSSPMSRVELKPGTGVTVDGERRYTVGTLTIGSPTTEVLQLGAPTLSALPGQSVTLKMRFNAVPMPENYQVFVHFVDSNGIHHSSLNADHAPPVATSVWSGAIAYDYTKALPSTAAAGTYTIRVGLYPLSAPSNRVELLAGSGVTVDGERRYTVGTLTIGSSSQTPGPVGQDPNLYVLTFRDEFNNGFDWSKWNDHIWYQSSHPVINYKVSNGSLKIWPDPTFVNRTIDTDGKFSQTYGYFEMEAKLPIGKGLWPAFWLYAHPADARPEIDIMEAYPGGGPNSGWGDSNLHPINYGLTLHKANADYSYHEVPYAKTLRNFSPYENGIDLSAAFHTYGVKWESSGITFYFDGKQLGSKWMDTAGYYNRPMYVLLDLWFGSASGQPDGTTPTGEGNSFIINYVRVWQFK